MGRCWGSKTSPPPVPRSTAVEPYTDVLASEVTVAGTTAVDFFSVPLEAGKAYNIDLRCFLDDLLSQAGTDIEVEYTGDGTAYVTGESEEAFDFYTISGGAEAVQGLNQDGADSSPVNVSGNINTVTAGDLVFRIVRQIADVDVSRVAAGATLVVTEITPQS